MKIKDLKPGDVLLFSPEKGSFISWAITFLTNANVSHAAMVYDKENLIEETPPQVRLANTAKRVNKDRKIYVRRLKEVTNLDKVITASKTYLNEHEPYNMTGLYMVGVLLVYKKFTPNTIKQRIIVKILRKIVHSITTYINEKKHTGKLPMVCSQFVAQCYEDAGAAYTLQITDGKKKMLRSQNNGGSLLDQAILLESAVSKKGLLSTSLTSSLQREETFETDEALCEELKNAFTSTNLARETPASLSQELVNAIADFGRVHNLLQSNNGKDVSNLTNPLTTLKSMETMFVTPGDLLNNCLNLEDLGEIEYE